MQSVLQTLSLITPWIIAILPFATFGISYGFQRVTHSVETNATIAGSTILVASVITLLLQGKLTGNPATDTAYVLSTAIALQSETFVPLQQYLRQYFPAPSPPAQPPPTEPKPIALPQNRPPASGQ